MKSHFVFLFIISLVISTCSNSKSATDIEGPNDVVLAIYSPDDTCLRLFYCIKGTHTGNLRLQPVEYPLFHRRGFSVVEWGVIIE